MKKILIVLFSILLTVLFLIPASAANQSENIEAKYESLREISNDLAKESRIGSTEFRELSADAVAYLQQFNIDTDSVGEIYYEVDSDGILVLRALSLMDDDSVRITTLTNYGQDENGNYGRIDHDDLLGQLRAISWSYTSYHSTKPYNNQITFYFNLYAYKGSMTINGQTHKCLRPYQTDFSFTYNQSNLSITNYYGNTSVSGALRYTDGTLITNSFTWATAYSLSSPSANTTYNRYNYLASDEMLDLYGYGNPYHNSSFYLNGSYRELSATLIEP